MAGVPNVVTEIGAGVARLCTDLILLLRFLCGRTIDGKPGLIFSSSDVFLLFVKLLSTPVVADVIKDCVDLPAFGLASANELCSSSTNESIFRLIY